MPKIKPSGWNCAVVNGCPACPATFKQFKDIYERNWEIERRKRGEGEEGKEKNMTEGKAQNDELKQRTFHEEWKTQRVVSATLRSEKLLAIRRAAGIDKSETQCRQE